jgi:hypothetical protein
VVQLPQFIALEQLKHPVLQLMHSLLLESKYVDYVGHDERHLPIYNGKPISHELQYVAFLHALQCVEHG